MRLDYGVSQGHQIIQLRQLLARLVASISRYDLENDFIACNKLELIELANKNYMGFPLYCGLKQKNLLQYLSEDERAYLEHLFKLNKERNLEFLKELNVLVLELNKLDIEVVLLKGAVALLDGWYEDIGERFLRDVDLLVAEDKAQLAFKHLLSLGYDLVNPLDEKLHELSSHQLGALHKNGSPLVVELHIAPITLKAKAVLNAKQVFADKLLVSNEQLAKCDCLQGEQADFYLPSPQHCLVIALVHTQIADNNRQNHRFFLRHAMDIERLLNRYGLTDVNSVYRLFENHGFEKLVPEYVQTLDFFFGTRFLETSALKFFSEDKTHLKQILDKLILDDKNSGGLSAKQSKRRYVLQQVLNAFSKEKIQMRYGVNSEPALSFYRVVNTFRLINKYFRTSNREHLNKAMDENLNTQTVLDDKRSQRPE